MDEGIDNDGFSEADQEVAELNNVAPSRKKVYRHNTDLSPTKKPKQFEDAIIEEDSFDMSEMPSIKRPARKKAITVSRHTSEVLRKRPQDGCVTPSNDLQQETQSATTRRSLSRHGSQVRGPRPQVLSDEESYHKLKSDKPEKHTKAKRKALTEIALRKLRQHHSSTRNIEGATQEEVMVKARATLEKHKTILLTGKVGSGKSFVAHNLLEYVIRTHADFKPIFIENLEDLEMINDWQSPLAVVADDFLGTYCFSECNYYVWSKTMKHIAPLIESKRIYLILTSEKEQLEYLTRNGESVIVDAFANNSLIDLDSEDLLMPSDELEDVLSQLLTEKGQQPNFTGIESHVNKMSNDLGQILSCHLASASSDVEEMLEDPLNCLAKIVRALRTHSLPDYTLLLTMLVLGGRAPNRQLKDEEAKLFRSVQTITGLNDMTYIELVSFSSSLTEKRLVVTDAMWDCFRFYHKYIHIAVCRIFIEDYTEHAVHLLPLDTISSISIKNNLFTQQSQPLKDSVDASSMIHHNYKTVIERYQTETQASQTSEKFICIASSHLWSVGTFYEIAFTILGIDFFFMLDDSKTTMATHLMKMGHIEIVLKLAEYIDKYKPDEIVGHQDVVKSMLCEACRTCQFNVTKSLLSLVTNVDVTIMRAAAEGGDVNILQILIHQGGQLFHRRSEVLQTACRFGNVSAVEFMLSHAIGEHSHIHPVNNASVIHAAASSYTSDVLEILVHHGANLQAQNQDGSTLLHTASAKGKLRIVKYLVEKQPDMLHMTDNLGFTAAHVAARDGHLYVLAYLIDQGVNTMSKVYKGNSILHLAAYNERVDILKYLCHKFPDLLKKRNSESFTALQLAAKSGRIKALQFFFQIGADILTKTIDGRSLLHLSAFYGQLDAVKYLCAHYPQLIAVVDEDGNTAAHDAAASGNVAVVKYLTEGRIDPLAVSKDGCTLLHDACFYGKLDVIKYFCHNYPQLLKQQSENGYTPSHGAALGGFVEILKYLVHQGADVNILSEDGCCLLHEATFGGQYSMVKYLCETFPAMTTWKNARSYTPCHFAVQEGHTDITDYILSKTKDEMSMTAENQTFLHIAAYNGHIDVVKYLSTKFPKLLKLADVNSATAIHYAARGGHVDILTYLMQYEFDPCSTTSNGSTMQHLAAYDGKYDMVVYLYETYPQLLTIVDSSKHNVAHYAAGSGNLPLLLYILDKGIDPMTLTDNESTLLLKAAYNGHIEVVKYLCSTYPDMLKMADVFGCNVAHYAACAGQLEVLNYVISEGIDPLELTQDGHTILHVSAFHGQLEMVSFLCQAYPELRHSVDKTGQTPDTFAKLGGHAHVVSFLKESSLVEKTVGSGAIGVRALLCCLCRRKCCRTITAPLREPWARIVACICICRK